MADDRFDHLGSRVQDVLAIVENQKPRSAFRRSGDPVGHARLLRVPFDGGDPADLSGHLDRNVMQGDAPLQRNFNQALAEMQRAAQALRVLSDYLQLHPESLLRGKLLFQPNPDLKFVLSELFVGNYRSVELKAHVWGG